MASVNKVIIVGRLGRDPEVRPLNGGGSITTLSVATSSHWRDRATGENREATEWHRVVLEGAPAELAQQTLKQGSGVYLEGSLRTRKWVDLRTGQDRYATEIKAYFIDETDTQQQRSAPPAAGPNAGYGEYEHPAPPRQSPAPAGQRYGSHRS